MPTAILFRPWTQSPLDSILPAPGTSYVWDHTVHALCDWLISLIIMPQAHPVVASVEIPLLRQNNIQHLLFTHHLLRDTWTAPSFGLLCLVRLQTLGHWYLYQSLLLILLGKYPEMGIKPSFRV